jgi:4-carboxymuconolactone decarboxylase
MRLPLITQAYDGMRAGIENSFQGFKSIADNGALLGPWNPWLQEPKFGKPKSAWLAPAVSADLMSGPTSSPI